MIKLHEENCMNQDNIKQLEKTIINEYSNIAGIIVESDGIKVYENYFNDFNAEKTIHIYSVTKSIFSALIGIAIDKGHIKSVNQKVLDFFPDYKIKSGNQNITSTSIWRITSFFKLFLN